MKGWIPASALVLVVGLGATAGTQEPRPQPLQPTSSQPADPSARCKAMMAEHGKMMAELKSADERLDQLVTNMNAATGQAKVDATAAAVTEIVAQRRTMRDRMMGMQQGAMSHMMEHMQAGPGSAAECPMMKMKPGGARQ